MKPTFPSLILPLLVASFALVASSARADPPTHTTEERYADGDIDAEDLVVAHLGRGGGGVSRSHAPTWVSLVGFTGVTSTGDRSYGGMAVVGLALDGIAAGSGPRIADRPDTRPVVPEPARVAINPSLARGAVAAAWRTAGLGADDDRIDAMVARARLSATLPETRLRAMRVMDERGRTDAALDESRSYDIAGARLLLEARLTWRLDRLLYADDEPTLERLRLERSNARARLAIRILETLFQWQRAQNDAPPNEANEASAQVLEAEIVLDVLTGGWFTTRLTDLHRTATR